MRIMPHTRRNWLLAAMLVTVGAAVMLRIFDPATSGVFPPCPVRYLTGWYCPGCGSLRALHALLHGNLRQAWAMNPLTLIVLPYLTYGLASLTLIQLRGKGLPQVILPANCIRALYVAIILFGIVRNLPFHPFNLLAPGAVLHP